MVPVWDPTAIDARLPAAYAEGAAASPANTNNAATRPESLNFMEHSDFRSTNETPERSQAVPTSRTELRNNRRSPLSPKPPIANRPRSERDPRALSQPALRVLSRTRSAGAQ